MNRVSLILPLLLVAALFAQTRSATASDILANLPNRGFIELIPGAVTETSPRSLGLGGSIEKLNEKSRTIAGVGTEILFPVFQNGRTTHVDWNTSFTMMGPLSETHWLGGRIGVVINHPQYQTMFVGIAFRAIPSGSHDWFTGQWVTKQIDAGIHSRGKLWAALRFAFNLF